MVGIKNRLIVVWKWIYTPSGTKDQWILDLDQRLKELAKRDFEAAFLEIRTRFEPEFCNTKVQIKGLQEEISELRQRLSTIESFLSAWQLQKGPELPELHSEEI